MNLQRKSGVRFSICIPTLNARETWVKFVAALKDQSIEASEVIVIDSESDDGTAELAAREGFRVLQIARRDFRHGATRQIAVQLAAGSEVLVYFTQDAILSNRNAMSRLVAAFDDPAVAVAYGRQIPRAAAGAIEAHARIFNYPEQSSIRDSSDKVRLGFKTAFVSNSFAAYRRSALMEVGGFPSDVIFGEDTVTAGKLLLAGHKIAYVAEAAVFHSHEYNWRQEFERYFDIGVLHQREDWLLKAFGAPSGEGRRFLISEFSYLFRKNIFMVPDAVIRTGLKYSGYKLGRMEEKLPLDLKRRFSMHKAFWSEDRH